jgi:RecJ-like exonuclease
MAQICQRCHGNGYIKVKESIENPTETIQQCPLCNSQGEIMDKNTFEETRQRHRIKTERLMLESELVKQLNGVIKKLNDEVDVLNDKNKNLTEAVSMLESKLKEKNDN